ncbi:hypothetical protein [Duganella phyllosphaerae]|uniref:hypothetical protein n=1 Tax=Duganella phyllosphaerae TaxID=762836 RepID=UPI0008756B89|nr:hypothetical protein [Duganella phyllosphaerae]
MNRLRTVLRLVPLVCAAWCGNALAVDVLFQGPPGSSGVNGATPGAPGTAGSAAPPASYLLFGADPVNRLVVGGGAAGNGAGAGAGGGLIMIGTDEPHPLINASAATAATAAHNLIFFILPPNYNH